MKMTNVESEKNQSLRSLSYKVHEQSGESEYFPMSEMKGLGFYYGQGSRVCLTPGCTEKERISEGHRKKINTDNIFRTNLVTL